MEDKEIESLMKYFGLEKPEDARKVKWILDELRVYGDWGDKVSAYFSAILSGTEGSRTLIKPNLVEAYKSLFYGRGDETGGNDNN